jgi:hypothetical protein
VTAPIRPFKPPSQLFRPASSSSLRSRLPPMLASSLQSHHAAATAISRRRRHWGPRLGSRASDYIIACVSGESEHCVVAVARELLAGTDSPPPIWVCAWAASPFLLAPVITPPQHWLPSKLRDALVKFRISAPGRWLG